MTQHLHGTVVPGCYRCDLSEDEMDFIRDEAVRIVSQAQELHDWWSEQIDFHTNAALHAAIIQLRRILLG